MRTDFDVIVIGGGPAGCAAALRLAPTPARVLLLDRAVFPRDKPCGGGLVHEADRYLALLGVRPRVPSARVDRIAFLYPGGAATQRGRGLFRVVRRREFDAALLRTVAARGVAVREGVRVTGLTRVRGGVAVASDAGDWRARVVIGADGAHSLVRRHLVGGADAARFVALEVQTRPAPGRSAAAHEARFDFRPAAAGLRGYAWDFPLLRDGRPGANRGVGGTTWRAGAPPRALLAAHLEAHGLRLDAAALQGATAPLYDPRRAQSAPHALLAGDAVGIDPWFGEGISVALGTGILAADTAAEGLAANDLRFAGHRRRIRDSAVGWRLCRQRAQAERFYRAAARPGGLAAWFGADAAGESAIHSERRPRAAGAA